MSPTGVVLAFELTGTGAAMRAQGYRREHPRATEEEVAAVVKAWMLERPGAPLGDAEGVPSTRFS